MRRLTAIVPMRHDSERVPAKNRRLFHGDPLYCRIIEVLARCECVEAIAVDTDSDEIAEGVRARFPSVRIVRRPRKLLGGSVDMNRILEHDLSELPGESFLQTHCTNPLLRPETIDSAARRLAASPGHDSAFGVTRLQTRLYDGSGAPLNHDPDDLVRTQDLRPVFEENSNLYLFSRSSFESAGGRIGRRPIMIEIDRLEAIDIDDEATWAMAEAAFAALRPQEAAT